MARGLLLHWVQLDAQGRVDAYQVVAPTEWNFHPDGALAQALMRLSPQDITGAALLGKAFDACVDCQVSPTLSTESCDA
jgi:Ni,Fe-hydrogenase I large subunit